VPHAAKKYLSAAQARALLATVRPRDLVGRTRRRLASELITDLVQVNKKIKSADKELSELVATTGSSLQDLHGIGPSGAARLVGDVADISRFASRGHLAACNGTAPLDASSGDQQRHRLSRAGNRRIDRALHIMAVVQLRHDTEGRAYYRRKLAAGQNPDGGHARTETAPVRRGPQADDQGRHSGEDGPGGTPGGDSAVQRG
jgi:transposase